MVARRENGWTLGKDSDERIPLRRSAPLLDAYLRFRESGARPFSVPGHKGRAHLLDEGLAMTVESDVPLYGGVDTVKLDGGYLEEVESRSAEWFGASWCRYSTGGSTHANQALCLAVGAPGDVVIVTRSLHRSLLIGLVLAGLVPVWLPPRVDDSTGLPTGVEAVDVEHAFGKNPTARAVFLTEPGYLGTLGDLSGAVSIAHRSNVPVVVDQAWGAHFGYHEEVPPHALSLGADALITSIHKLLPGHSQASLLCAQLDYFDVGRLQRGFDATHTTSPSGSILASIDGSRALLEQRGHELLGRTLDIVREARLQLRNALPGIVVPDETWFPHGRFDPLRLVVVLSTLGADGVAVEQYLGERGFPLELADRDTLIPVITVADDRETVLPMIDAMVEGIRLNAGPPRPVRPGVSWLVEPVVEMPPRDAFFARHETVSAEKAVGRIAAELVAPYPPGIPVLAPGERITEELLTKLQDTLSSGVRIAYAKDPMLSTFEVIA